MISDKNQQELDDKGYTVLSGILTNTECDSFIQKYKEWLAQFQDGNWPRSKSSLIHNYNTGNFEVTWDIRLKSKKVFSQVWKTEKLLSSVDAIAVGRPPEDGEEDFEWPGTHWLHTDQSARRKGLHAYQGAVYLEETEEDDWTFHLMEGSHKYLDEFYENNSKQAFKSSINEYYHLRDEDYEWFTQKGCRTIRCPVPKGGMVLWDSRLIHANARPVKGRKNAGRWRFTTFVCMTPAIWATEKDYEQRKLAYENGCMTSHWPSLGVRFVLSRAPGSLSDTKVVFPEKLPPNACTMEAQKLWGNLKYDFNDGRSNGPEWVPEINKALDFDSDTTNCKRTTFRSIFHGSLNVKLAIGVAGFSLVAFIFLKYLENALLA